MSDDRHLSGEEKRAKLKEEYKKELLARRQILDDLEQKRKTSGAEKALSDLLGLTESNPLLGDDTDSWIAKLKETAATAEAKIDMIMERFSGETGAGSPAPTPSQTTSPAASATPAAPTSDQPDPAPRAKTLGDLGSEANTPTPPPSSAPNEAPSSRKTLGDVEG